MLVGNDIKNEITSIINESVKVKNGVATLGNDIQKAIDIIVDCYKKQGKVIVCGNGGSAADAQHMVGELVGRFKMERRALPCIALTTNTSTITAWSNDYGFETIFERQLEALGNKGDTLVAISTSGNSKNVIKAIQKAKEMNIKIIALLGNEGGKIKNFADLNIVVKSNDTPRIQEAHIMIIHILCELIEKTLFK